MPEGPSVQDLSVLACCRLGITQIMQQPQIPSWSCGTSLPAPPEAPPPGLRLACTPRTASTARQEQGDAPKCTRGRHDPDCGKLLAVGFAWKSFGSGSRGKEGIPPCIIGVRARRQQGSSAPCASQETLPCWLCPHHLLPRG